MRKNGEKTNSRPKGINDPAAVARYRAAVTKYKAVEIERSSSMAALTKAAERLRVSHKPQKVLVVPTHSMKRATTAMVKAGISGTVRNISGTRREYVAATAATGIKESTQRK